MLTHSRFFGSLAAVPLVPTSVNVTPDGTGDITSAPLDHALVPFRSNPRYLRLVTTMSHVLDYAAGGFHVAVARGMAGGCTEDAVTFGRRGANTRAIACTGALHRPDLQAMWSRVAGAYQSAYAQAKNGSSGVEAMKNVLRTANSLADQAYAQEGVDPPRDPKTGTSEPPVAKRSLWGIGLVTAIGGMGLVAADYMRRV